MFHKKAIKRAIELVNELASDPIFVERQRAREAQREAVNAKLLAEEMPILQELHAHGESAQSVWDYVNLTTDYSNAIPILHKHLKKPYSPEITEGLVRSLALPQLAGQVTRDFWEIYDRNKFKSCDDLLSAIIIAMAAVAVSNNDKERLLEIQNNHTNPLAIRTAAKYALDQLFKS